MGSMLRRLAALFAGCSLLLGGAWAPPVLAGQQGFCQGADTSKVILWENAIGDNTDGNDSLWKCDDDISLVDDQHLPAGDCKGFLVGQANWNDCVSSFTVWIPAGKCLLMYRDTNYRAAFPVMPGPALGVRVNAPALLNDTLSSLRWMSC